MNNVPPLDLSVQYALIGEEVNAAVLKVLASGRYIGGPAVESFEQNFASYLGVSQCVGCNSGTDALFLALRALNIGPGDEVITTPFTFVATAEAISAVGATPIFVDIDADTLNLDLEKLEAAITSKTRAILPVHLFGQPMDMTRLMAIASSHGLTVIEDCAQSTGAEWAGQKVGSIGHVGCFSFFPTKNLGACGDGGAVTTNDPAIAARVRMLKEHGQSNRYYCEATGINSRLDALQATILQIKLRYLNTWNAQRRAAADRYHQLLSHVPGLVLPQELPGGKGVWNQYTIRIKSQEKSPPRSPSPSLPLPEVYGFCQLEDSQPGEQVLLLENAPVDAIGRLYPSIVESWLGAPAVRQVYWLWQILQLWTPLSAEKVASSLLAAENIRVENWRVRLLELLPESKIKPQLRELAEIWQPWVEAAQPSVQLELQEICQLLRRGGMTVDAIARELNQLLLEVAAQLPLQLEIDSATDTGPQRDRNEDSCYPTNLDLQRHPQIPYLAIVCDGVGGHEGGEVASQLAVESLKPLIQNLIAEIAQQPELTPPEIVSRQLEEIVRVVNNVIAAQNNEQNRELRQRMGTTLVMALQLPQKVNTSAALQLNNSHELYLVNVGDSRAYWLTENGCCRLTVDDDVASREVRLGNCLYWEAQRRSDAGALTQALGTRAGEYLHPAIQRLIVEEDGLLLLCSDGLSDNDWVEKSWFDYAPGVLKGEISLESAVAALIRKANEKNGYDNTSVVMLHCRVSPEKLVLFNPIQLPNTTGSLESELSEASKALLYAETVAVHEPRRQKEKSKRLLLVLGLLALFLVGGAGTVWYRDRQQQQKLEPIPLFPNTPPPKTN